jgi:hypothetical protein
LPIVLAVAGKSGKFLEVERGWMDQRVKNIGEACIFSIGLIYSYNFI